MQLRWITITTLLLAIGVLLRSISPNIGGISLNWNIVMYCLAILLCRPNLQQGFGIGLVSGIIAMMTSKAALPYANLVSDPIASMCCVLLVSSRYKYLSSTKLSIFPFITIFITTFISGGLFVTLTKIFLELPLNIYLYVMLPTVLLVALLGAVAGQMLYIPAFKLFNAQSDNKKPKFQLNDINLNIPKGSFNILTGVNGSGKTTLLLRLAGINASHLQGISNSQIRINGIDILNSSSELLHQKIGLVLADYNAQLVTQTVEDEIAFSLETSGLNHEEIKKTIATLLSQVGLEKQATMPISALSGGQKQRLAIACVMALNTDVIILDEPIAAIDPEGAIDIYRLLVKLNKQYQKTIIVAEHDLKYVLDFADNIMVLDQGKLSFFGKLEEGLTHIYTQQIYPEVLPLRWKIRYEMRLKYAKA